MYVFSAFNHSVSVELAITDLQRLGIEKEAILAVPLTKITPELSIMDTIHRSDGSSVLDGAAAVSTVFMVFGVIYGFVLTWGPIVWGLIGMISGFIVGLLLDLYITKKNNKIIKLGKNIEVIIVISCDEKQRKSIENILRRHCPLGLAVVKTEK